MISIIIPTLNEELVIESTIRALKEKLTIPHEIIISDGKSTDRTVEIARFAGAKVVAYAGSTRQTIAMGRNDGAAAASPESQFLVFIDADCSIKDPDHFFTVCLDHFARDPKLNALCVARRVLPELETAADRVIFDLYNDYFWFMNNVIHFNMSAGEMQMVRRCAFISIGGYNGSLVASEDVDLFQRLGKTGKVRYEKGLVIYHTGRRGHAIGWPKLLSQWFLNSIWMMVLGRAFTKEWEPIRTADKTSANRHP